jgi:putative ABC transport system permease protein
MWKNYALSLYRTLSRHRLYAALNVLGLALGLAVCMVLLLVVRFETSFDRWIPDAANIYRVNMVSKWPGRPPSEQIGTQGVMAPLLKADFPQIVAIARLMELNLVVRVGDRQAYERVILADPETFKVFGLPFAAGSPAHALDDTSGLVISQQMAIKYFGTDHALGRRLTLVIEGAPRDYRITGVLKDLPANTHLSIDFMARLAPEVLPKEQFVFDDWGSSTLVTYIRVGSASEARAISAGLDAFIDRHTAGKLPPPAHKFVTYKLAPLTGIHFARSKAANDFKPGADPLFVGSLGLMGVVTLLIAVVNYVSLATARAGMRAREVAVRKVMGATRRALIIQFTAESVAVTLAAGLIAAAMAELALPGIGAMLGEPIRMTYFGADGVALPLIGLCLGVGLLAGLYPAVALSAFRPASVLASARTPGGGRAGGRVREGLAVFQFAIAICLMICTAVIFAQIQFVRNADPGYRRDGLIIVKGIGEPELADRRHALIDAMAQTPGVISATTSNRRPATDSESNTNISLVGDPQMEPVLTVEIIGPDYFETYGVPIVAGRALDMGHGLDDSDGLKGEDLAGRGLNLVINEAAAQAFGFRRPRDAVGRQLHVPTSAKGGLNATIVGVAGDVRFLSPREPVPPQFYMQDSTLGPPERAQPMSVAVRVKAGEEAAMTRRLEATWRSIAPETPFQSQTVRAAMKPFFDPDARRGQLFALGAVLAVTIACMGLYGLAAFNTGRRFKEIGIRKTLGASTADIVRLLLGEFLRPVLLANLVAWPLAFFAMRPWLAGFDQRIALNPAYFLIPTLAAILVAVITVAEQAIRVARAEPARALRYE